ncbi:uncharacterized protein LOC141649274 [Silene latifolia]|uniref:uncharacterized protein LOC141649274 n=1 Tax=Silene latifolia TaxID=37657 RepID=UPI003D776F7B
MLWVILISYEVPRGIPSNVELTDVNPEYPRFPDIIYGFEASILSSQLIPLITDLLTLPPDSLPDFVTLDLQKASVRLTVGEKTVEKAADRNELWFVWPYWETLRRAASTSKECSVYQTTEPPENLMLLFKFTDPDDTITFTRGTYSCNKKVSCLAFLSALT